ANTAEVLESVVLGDAATARPDASDAKVGVAITPQVAGVTKVVSEGTGGTHPPGATYKYRFVFADDSGSEGMPSGEVVVTIPPGNGLPDDSIILGNLPDSPDYPTLNIYRTADGGSDFFLLDSVPTVSNGGAATYTDDNSIALSDTPLDQGTINGSYSYLITYHRAGEPESRPSEII